MSGRPLKTSLKFFLKSFSETFKGFPNILEQNQLHIWNQHVEKYPCFENQKKIFGSINPYEPAEKKFFVKKNSVNSLDHADSKYIIDFALGCQEGPKKLTKKTLARFFRV